LRDVRRAVISSAVGPPFILTPNVTSNVYPQVPSKMVNAARAMLLGGARVLELAIESFVFPVT
jgi:hypothetical protein